MLCIPDNIKMCLFNEDAVILNLDKDSFHIIEKGAELFGIHEFEADQLHALDDAFSIKRMPVLRVEPGSGYFEIRWMRPFFYKEKITLAKKILYFFKIKGLVNLVEGGGVLAVRKKIIKLRSKMPRNTRPIDSVLNKSNNIIGSIMRYYDLQNPCLIYSFIMTNMLIEQGYDARIIIGVRTEPFFSHAWVEINGVVYGDDRDLRNKLSVIMEI